MELIFKEYSLPQMGIANFEEIKKDLIEKTEVYGKIVYTDENIQTAKADRSTLNKFIKAVNDERIRIQKEYMKPFDSLKAQCDELMKIAEEPKAAIDKVVKEYEAIKQDEKRAAIESMFKDMCFPEFVKLDQKIFDPRWLNATVSMKQIEESLLKTKEDIIQNCQTLAGLPTYSQEAVIYYQRTLDVTGALAKVRELSEIEAAKKKMQEEERHLVPMPGAERLAELKAEYPTEIPVAPDKPEEPQMWVQFEALLNSTQAAALKAFFNANGIEFRPIKIKEDK
jgi:hypothetical protein